jgi:hypothetical protein
MRDLWGLGEAGPVFEKKKTPFERAVSITKGLLMLALLFFLMGGAFALGGLVVKWLSGE